MCRQRNNSWRRATRCRRGLTLAELLVATAILAILVGAIGGLALTVQTANEHSQGQNLATQHARVVVERIERALNEAHASESFPGFAAFSNDVGTWEFPDTLVVWRPNGPPVDGEGTPQFNELVVFCTDPNNSHRLLEITEPNDMRPTPPLSDSLAWQTELAALKSSPTANRVQLTNLLRAHEAVRGNASSLRAAVRFRVRLRPTEQDWDDYKVGTKNWDELPWAQDLFGAETGVRQSWCYFEIQLMPDESSFQTDPAGQSAIPFFGSAAIYSELPK